ncbi:universal stress protein [Bacillus sp. V3B]|uniref:universal stress protein n=1 Tax=Bacillus sp. V3B TaxID=2804915 RepID=UPI002108F4C8|nr:universal stress protein [Bacillus sp. V3B]MCQ6276264.1 universal stress protein [Bacillus sp. V3B]
MYNHILLATDGSNNSLRAADQAIKLASTSNDALIEIIYVVDFETSKRDTLQNMNSVTIEQERKKRIQLTEGKLKAAGVKSKSTILHGEPGPTIVSYANNQPFDVVVIGSRGLNSLQEMVLGSVSHKVAKRVQCPVMIVK